MFITLEQVGKSLFHAKADTERVTLAQVNASRPFVHSVQKTFW